MLVLKTDLLCLNISLGEKWQVPFMLKMKRYVLYVHLNFIFSKFSFFLSECRVLNQVILLALSRTLPTKSPTPGLGNGANFL